MDYQRTNRTSIHRQQDDWDEVHNQLLAIQKKSLNVSNPSDPDEKEANEVARKIMRGENAQVTESANGINRIQKYDGGNPKGQESRGQFTFTRAEQAKHEFGLECYGSTLMYILQSYGLVPQTFTIDQFEKKYTRLNPDKKGTSEEHNNPNALIYKNNMDVFTYRFTQLGAGRWGKHKTAQEAACYALRGFPGVTLVPMNNGEKDLEFYLEAFSEMNTSTDASPAKTGKSDFAVKDLTKTKLDGKTKLSGQLDVALVDNHLANGDTIYAGIDLYKGIYRKASVSQHESLSMDHRVLIKEKLGKVDVTNGVTSAKETIHVYGADDAWHGYVAILDHRIPDSGTVQFGSSKLAVTEAYAKLREVYPKVQYVFVFSKDAYAANRTSY